MYPLSRLVKGIVEEKESRVRPRLVSRLLILRYSKAVPGTSFHSGRKFKDRLSRRIIHGPYVIIFREALRTFVVVRTQEHTWYALDIREHGVHYAW